MPNPVQRKRLPIRPNFERRLDQLNERKAELGKQLDYLTGKLDHTLKAIKNLKQMKLDDRQAVSLSRLEFQQDIAKLNEDIREKKSLLEHISNKINLLNARK